MAMSGSGLESTLRASILVQIQALFPINGSLLPAEQSSLQSFQQKLANAVADGSGGEIVTHIKDNAVVNPGTLAVTPSAMSNGAGPLSGNGAVNVGTGTVE